MQRKIGTEIELHLTAYVLCLPSTGQLRKKRKLIETDTYHADIARYTPGNLDLMFQGMLEHIDTKEQPAHSLHRDMENLDFQMLFTDNYYTNPNSIHLCFQMKIKKSSDKDDDIEFDLITVNNCFAHLIKEISMTRYGNDKQLIPTFSPYEIYQYSDSMAKHLPKILLKNLKKQCFIVNRLCTITKQRLIEGLITAQQSTLTV